MINYYLNLNNFLFQNAAALAGVFTGKQMKIKNHRFHLIILITVQTFCIFANLIQSFSGEL
jgi:hypothetical protein